MRDPHAVALSVLRRGFLNEPNNKYRKYVEKYRPDIARIGDHVGRVIRWAATWDTPLEGAPLLRFDSSPDDVSAAVEYATGVRVPIRQVAEVMTRVGPVNADAGPVPGRDILAQHPDYHLIRERAERYGYGT